MNSLIHWILTFALALWKFGNPPGLQIPKWELTLECEGYFLHTLLHFRGHEVWLPGFPLGSQPCKPKAKVATKAHVVYLKLQI
jgi:hypothetical protein